MFVVLFSFFLSLSFFYFWFSSFVLSWGVLFFNGFLVFWFCWEVLCFLFSSCGFFAVQVFSKSWFFVIDACFFVIILYVSFSRLSFLGFHYRLFPIFDSECLFRFAFCCIFLVLGLVFLDVVLSYVLLRSFVYSMDMCMPCCSSCVVYSGGAWL